jgi:hypothetical protein
MDLYIGQQINLAGRAGYVVGIDEEGMVLHQLQSGEVVRINIDPRPELIEFVTSIAPVESADPQLDSMISEPAQDMP